MIRLWRVLPEATADGQLFGPTFYEMPPDVQVQANARPPGSPFALFLTDELVGLATHGRAGAVLRSPARSVVLEVLQRGRGGGAYTVLVDDRPLARWPDTKVRSEVATVARAIADALGAELEERDAGVNY